jgi:hypothetical protein
MAKLIVKTFCLVAILSIVGQVRCKEATGSSTNQPETTSGPVDEYVNYALVHFMDKTRDEFMKLLPGIKNAIASSLTTYCTDEAPSCGDEIS